MARSSRCLLDFNCLRTVDLPERLQPAPLPGRRRLLLTVPLGGACRHTDVTEIWTCGEWKKKSQDNRPASQPDSQSVLGRCLGDPTLETDHLSTGPASSSSAATKSLCELQVRNSSSFALRNAGSTLCATCWGIPGQNALCQANTLM